MDEQELLEMQDRAYQLAQSMLIISAHARANAAGISTSQIARLAKIRGLLAAAKLHTTDALKSIDKHRGEPGS